MTAAGTPASIDVHAHCVPQEVVTALLTDGDRYGIELPEVDGRRRVVIAGRDAGPLRPDLVDLPRRLAAMDATGVAVQVLSSWIDLTAYGLPRDQGRRYARMFNEALAAEAATHPGRFRAVCTVPLQWPAAAAEELRYAVGELGMVGVEIATTVAGRELDDPELEPFWAAAEEIGCLVLVHPCASLAGRGVTRHFLGNLVGNPAETTIAVGHLIFGGVLERHPDLRVCAVHGGGFAPYQVGRWDHAFHRDARGAATHLRRPPSEWVARLYHDTVLHSTRSLRMLLDLVGPGQVVLGSDYPFEMGDPDPLATVAAVPGLSEAERAMILAGNLAALFAATAERAETVR
ncbi:MAG: amidohydrolase family protein [Micromonosporaceae bacterium]